MTEKHTPEKVAELVAEVQRQNDNPHQYGPGAVEDLRDRLADALTEVSAERDDAIQRMLTLDQANDEEIDRTDRAEADRDRLHKAITDALAWLDDERLTDDQHIGGARVNLRAALDKEGEGDE